MVKTEHIPYLLTVAASGSINKASIKLNYPVQKLSTIMTNVENEFDTCFFVRSRHGISLTQEGEVFIRQLREMDSLMQETRRQLMEMKMAAAQPVKGEVLFYSVPIFNDGYYVSAFKDFARAYTDVYLNLLTDSMEHVLEHVAAATQALGLILNIREKNSRVEACLARHSELVYYPLFRRTLAVICRKDSPFIHMQQKAISLKSLQDVPYVAWSVDRKCAASSISMINHIVCSQIKYHTANKELVYDILCSKPCFSVVGVDDVNQEYVVEHPELALIPLRDQVYSEDTLVVRRDAVLSKAEQSFVKYLFDYRTLWSSNGEANHFLDCSGCEKPKM